MSRSGPARRPPWLQTGNQFLIYLVDFMGTFLPPNAANFGHIIARVSRIIIRNPGIVLAAAPSIAQTPYDGLWSVPVVTKTANSNH
jgi:hypothetical protein